MICVVESVFQKFFYMIANAAVLLLFVFMKQTRLFAELLNWKIFFKISRI